MSNFFETHKKAQIYYETSDGNIFYKKTDAENHAKSLEDKLVKGITKTS